MMYLLVTMEDRSKMSAAIAALLEIGLSQFTTGEKMSSICPECQNRNRCNNYPVGAHSLLSEGQGNSSQLYAEPMYRAEHSHPHVAPEISQLYCQTVFRTKQPVLPEARESVQHTVAPLLKHEERGGLSRIPAEDLFIERNEQSCLRPDYSGMLPGTSGSQDAGVLPSTTDSAPKKMKLANPDDHHSASMKRLYLKVAILNDHLMRLHRVNKDGTSYYFCFYRNRSASKCPGTFNVHQASGRVTEMVKHNHEPNADLNKREIEKYQQKEIVKNNSVEMIEAGAGDQGKTDARPGFQQTGTPKASPNIVTID